MLKKKYTLNHKQLSKATRDLIAELVSSIEVEGKSWTGRLKIVVEVERGQVVDKFAKLVVSTDKVFETDTTIISAADLASSTVFEAMIKKTEE
jgi:hypothetical protein